MTTNPLTTEQIRNLVAWNPVTCAYDEDRYAAFDGWRNRERADAWDEGWHEHYLEEVRQDTDPTHPITKNNPYSQGVDA